jgi:hypothetical protein
MVIKQYKVENNVAVGINPYVHEQRGSFTVISADRVNEYASFDESAHTYATNAQDGVYDADLFGEPAEQGFYPSEGWVTKEIVANNSIWETMPKRQFLPFNPIPKMETTELPSPEPLTPFGWTEIDIDSENYPADFEECLLKDIHGNKHIGYMIKYGDDISNSEWELYGSAKDVEFQIVTHFISLKNI